jgi:hypothetical protein
MITLDSTARALARNRDLGLTKKRALAVLQAAMQHWHEGLAEGDEVDATGIGRIIPMRWKLTEQHNQYRIRVGKPPLNREYTWRLKLDGDVNLKAKLRRAMSR